MNNELKQRLDLLRSKLTQAQHERSKLLWEVENGFPESEPKLKIVKHKIVELKSQIEDCELLLEQSEEIEAAREKERLRLEEQAKAEEEKGRALRRKEIIPQMVDLVDRLAELVKEHDELGEYSGHRVTMTHLRDYMYSRDLQLLVGEWCGTSRDIERAIAALKPQPQIAEGA